MESAGEESGGTEEERIQKAVEKAMEKAVGEAVVVVMGIVGMVLIWGIGSEWSVIVGWWLLGIVIAYSAAAEKAKAPAPDPERVAARRRRLARVSLVLGGALVLWGLWMLGVSGVVLGVGRVPSKPL